MRDVRKFSSGFEAFVKLKKKSTTTTQPIVFTLIFTTIMYTMYVSLSCENYLNEN